MMNANSIVTLAEYKAYAKVKDTKQDLFFQNMINAVSDLIEECIRRPARLQSFPDVIYNGTGTDEIIPVYTPVYSLMSGAKTDLQYRVDPLSAWQNLITDDMNRVLIDQANPCYIRLFGALFPFGEQNVKLSTKAGFAKITKVYDELFGTGNGVLVTFTGSLLKVPIVKGSAKVVATLTDTTAVSVTDNGEGAFVGTGITSGTIDYETGDVALTFSDDVKIDTNILITYQFYAVPGEITLVCLEKIQEIHEESAVGVGRLGQRSRSLPNSGGTDSYYELSDRHRAMLAGYVKPMV